MPTSRHHAHAHRTRGSLLGALGLLAAACGDRPLTTAPGTSPALATYLTPYLTPYKGQPRWYVDRGAGPTLSMDAVTVVPHDLAYLMVTIDASDVSHLRELWISSYVTYTCIGTGAWQGRSGLEIMYGFAPTGVSHVDVAAIPSLSPAEYRVWQRYSAAQVVGLEGTACTTQSATGPIFGVRRARVMMYQLRYTAPDPESGQIVVHEQLHEVDIFPAVGRS